MKQRLNRGLQHLPETRRSGYRARRGSGEPRGGGKQGDDRWNQPGLGAIRIALTLDGLLLAALAFEQALEIVAVAQQNRK